MAFAVGSLISARGREWVVLPDSTEDLLVARPLGGTDDEIAGICTALEEVKSATFALPDPAKVGDYRSCRLLRDALRLGFRSSAGPFRSFGQLAVDPRPYQLVPLLMGLKLDPVRLLIADDVGIGKSIEACMVARELLDRGEAARLAVLCPPHLAEQWQAELREKFHIEAELVLTSTATRLEHKYQIGHQSLFDVCPYVVVSTDFIKSDRRRDDFLRACPELVIVDEAHSCAYGAVGRGGRHQRYELVKGLAADRNRHMIFVTATPHSGKDESFRSLLAFLHPEFTNLPDDLRGKENEHHRRHLAGYFIQRRRADIRHYMRSETLFPEREEAEETYELSGEYKSLFNRVLAYARETVVDKEGRTHRQRVKWWSALALLRSLASSPAAAAATLRTRAIAADTETAEEADEIGEQTVFDLNDEEISEWIDTTPGCDVGDKADDEASNRRRLLAMARDADELKGNKDNKVLKAAKLVKAFLEDGFSPILFCRFIPTAEYVAEQLRNHLPKGIEVVSITGILPPKERENRILRMKDCPKKVLVCTDCLSEGINLQEQFDAVMHYDLCWNPTRHEQREGRVDRFGQDKSPIRVLTYYGKDNQIDGIVLDVLIRKHRAIRRALGISVAVPASTSDVIEAIFEGLLLRQKAEPGPYLPGFEEYFKPRKEDLFRQWDNATEKEKRSRSMFAQESIKVDEVARELKAVQNAIGSGVDVASFTKEAFRAYKAVVSGDGTSKFDLVECPRGLREAVGNIQALRARFEMPVDESTVYLNRTHPIVEGLANYVMNSSLDPISDSIACRTGAIYTKEIQRRTTVILLRFRYHIIRKTSDLEKPLLAEDCQLLAFEGSPANAKWMASEQSEALLEAEPDRNITTEQASGFVKRVTDEFDKIEAYLEQKAKDFGKELLDAHQRARRAAKARGVSYRVEPKLPPDVLGIYVYLPAE